MKSHPQLGCCRKCSPQAHRHLLWVQQLENQLQALQFQIQIQLRKLPKGNLSPLLDIVLIGLLSLIWMLMSLLESLSSHLQVLLVNLYIYVFGDIMVHLERLWMTWLLLQVIPLTSAGSSALLQPPIRGQSANVGSSFSYNISQTDNNFSSGLQFSSSILRVSFLWLMKVIWHHTFWLICIIKMGYMWSVGTLGKFPHLYIIQWLLFSNVWPVCVTYGI